MAAWLNVNAPAEAAEPPAQVRRVGSDVKEVLQRELNHMILSLQTAQTNRQMQASAWKTWLTPGELLHDAIATNKAHNDKTKGVSGHTHGPPHVQSYRAFVAKLINMSEALAKEQIDKDQLALVKEHLKAYETQGVDNAWQTIDQFRVRITKEKQGILNYQLSSMLEPTARHRIEHALAHMLMIIGSQIKPGAPPRSDAERKIQNNIDEVRAILGINVKKQ